MIKQIPSLHFSLESCAADEIKLGNGARFFKRLDPNLRLKYLHKIFPPVTQEELRATSKLFGFNFSDEYKCYMTSAGPFSLFNQSINLFGLESTISRSLELDQQKPVSLSTEYSDFSTSCTTYADEGWLSVGAISMNKKIWLALDENGKGLICTDSRFILQESFYSMMEFVISSFYLRLRCSAPGPADRSQIEESILGEFQSKQ